jgi:hypothetical protein
MTFFDSTKSIIENLYLLSGPLLFLISLIAIKQLKVTKESIKINSQRQASTMSFEICEKYEKSLEQKHSILNLKLKELDIDSDKIFALNPSSLRNLPEKITTDNEFKKILENRNVLSYYIIDLLNELEGYCIPFIRKLADEELAYDLQFHQFYCWTTLCMTEIHYIQNKKDNLIKIDYYGNICDLYSIWKARNEKEDLDRQVANLNLQRNKINTQVIKPIGT